MCKRKMSFCIVLTALFGYCGRAAAEDARTTASSTTSKTKINHPLYDDVVKLMWPHWDTNHDGKFHAKEIDIWMQARHVHGPHAAALATVRARMRSLPKETRSTFSITLEELLAPEGSGPIVKPADPATGAKEHRFSFRGKYKQFLKDLEVYEPKLFAGEGPNFMVLKQGPIGDCFFFSVTGAIWP